MILTGIAYFAIFSTKCRTLPHLEKQVIDRNESALFFHDFHKPEHFVRSVAAVIRVIPIGLKMLAPKLIYLKTTFVDVKMNIPFFKIGSTRFPYFRLWILLFNCFPCGVSNPFGVLLRYQTVFQDDSDV